MICSCCYSNEINLNPLGLQKYAACSKCGFLFAIFPNQINSPEKILNHYRKEDPAKRVAFSKKPFFEATLKHLSSKIVKNDKIILDVGCGGGDFIEYACKKGWSSYGIEIVEELIEYARMKNGKETIFEGKLKNQYFSDNMFDAITLWDVIAIVDDFHDELSECFRILRSGGTIGIRTRNVIFQKTIYQFYRCFKKFCLRIGLKEPYVFNKYCFSSKSLKILLSRIGFQNIIITNSPLTSGDPYNHMPFHYPVKIAKIGADIISKVASLVSRGRWVTAPSLLIWAEKP
jgi:2-polyprenyl-3-methyl-5-hydroxy-6-metoxy-1,4-benzoquinol methylase